MMVRNAGNRHVFRVSPFGAVLAGLLVTAGHLSTVDWVRAELPAMSAISPWESTAAVIVGVIVLVSWALHVSGRLGAHAAGAALGPDRRMWCCHPRPVVDANSAERGLGICIPVFNGNAYPVRLAVAKDRVYYGSRVADVRVEGIDDDIPPLSQRRVLIYVQVVGSLAAEIHEDLKRGTTKEIDVRELWIAVEGGQRSGRLRLPESAVVRDASGWIVDVPGLGAHTSDA